jgi:hypothetical protein
VTLPNPPDYDQATAALFDHLSDPYLTPVVRLRVSVLLQLTSLADITGKLGISQAQAIQEFSLQPILDIIAKGRYTP